MISQVAEADFNTARDKLSLKPLKQAAGYTLYANADDQARLAFGNGLLAIVEGSMQRWFSEAFRERQPHLVRGYESLLARVEAAGYLAGVELLAVTNLSASITQLSLASPLAG